MTPLLLPKFFISQCIFNHKVQTLQYQDRWTNRDNNNTDNFRAVTWKINYKGTMQLLWLKPNVIYVQLTMHVYCGFLGNAFTGLVFETNHFLVWSDF